MEYNWSIIGHKNVVDFLQTSLRRGKLSHAYLFFGPQKVGKTTVAEYFAKSLLCSSKEQVPCHQCPVCEQMDKKIHPDLFLLERQEDKKDITIEQIQQLRKFISLSAFLGKYKIAIIKEAEFLNQEAANCLLKTLEEPTRNSIIILITYRINSLLKTIISRCQKIRFLPVPQKEIIQFLEEKYSLVEKSAPELARISQGKPGLAIQFFQNPEIFQEYQKRATSLSEFFQGSCLEKFNLINQLVSYKEFIESQKVFQELLSSLSFFIRDIILVKMNLEPLVFNFFIKEKLAHLARQYSLEKLTHILDEINQANKYLKRNIVPRLVMENLILTF